MKKRPEENAMKCMSILIFAAVFAWFGLYGVPNGFGVVPPPDGGYPNFTTAEGQNALLNLTSGVANTAVGSFSLESLTTGSFNTAVGAGTLLSNNGDSNTAIGTAALLANTDGDSNTAVGVDALLNNTGGGTNTATGAEALISNIEGSFNTATGFGALSLNVNGCCNTANGTNALFLSTGSGNTAVGFFALSNITTGTFNVAVGENAGDHLTEGDSNNIDIGFAVEGVAGESNTIRIGNNDITDTFIRGVSGTTIASGTTVLVASNGHLGTVTSSQRFKENVKPMDKASEALFSLKPVAFRYRKEIDPVGTLQFGLVAEDVEKINPNLVVRDEKGRVNSVRYDQVNAMLLNEFLKEHRKVRELEATLALQQNDFQSKLSEQEKQIAALAAGLHKVSAELDISRPVRQLVLNNP
ncbi:MAG: tail fiber domain-containing protein [Candidatus Udaeobacter sp.]